MITVKDGQIVVTELRPMSEARTEIPLLVAHKDGKNVREAIVYKHMPEGREVYVSGHWMDIKEFIGFIPLPIYQTEPKQSEFTCAKCGAVSAKHAVQVCSVDPDSDEVCPGSCLWG